MIANKNHLKFQISWECPFKHDNIQSKITKEKLIIIAMSNIL